MASDYGYKSDTYATKVDTDEIEDLSQRLQTDLRGHVRRLGDFPILSASWLDMAKSLRRIGDITRMEVEIEKDSKDATLWECDEIALRFLLEDGKLNLCLRNLVAFKEKQREMRREKATVTVSIADAMKDFEVGSGIMLKHAWLHVEAMQMTDLPALVEHCGAVLNEVVVSPDQIKGRDLTDLQEVVCISYLQTLLTHMEDIGEHRIMPLFTKCHICSILLAFLNLHWQALETEQLETAAETLALIFDSEDYSTHEERYLETPANKKHLKEFYGAFVEALVSEDRDKRRKLRPLMDVVEDLEDD